MWHAAAGANWTKRSCARFCSALAGRDPRPPAPSRRSFCGMQARVFRFGLTRGRGRGLRGPGGRCSCLARRNLGIMGSARRWLALARRLRGPYAVLVPFGACPTRPDALSSHCRSIVVADIVLGGHRLWARQRSVRTDLLRANDDVLQPLSGRHSVCRKRRALHGLFGGHCCRGERWQRVRAVPGSRGIPG